MDCVKQRQINLLLCFCCCCRGLLFVDNWVSVMVLYLDVVITLPPTLSVHGGLYEGLAGLYCDPCH